MPKHGNRAPPPLPAAARPYAHDLAKTVDALPKSGAILIVHAHKELPARRRARLFEAHLADFVAAYNFRRRLKSLRGFTPFEIICKNWTSEPDQL